jgi:phage terminase small subunit
MPILENSQYERFAQELATGSSASAAYVAAGYKKHDSNASRLSRNDKVRSRVEELLLAASERAGITRERIQAELAKIAFSDIRMAVQWGDGIVMRDEGGREYVLNDVSLVSSDRVDGDTAAAIGEVSRTKDGMKIKMYDKQKALELLGKDIGMFKEKVEHSGAVSLETLVAGSMKSDV